jgi:hypothetical protein
MFGPWPGVAPGGGGGAVVDVNPGAAISITGVAAHPVVNYIGGPYPAGTAALQAAGVLQQTYAAPTATPRATAMGANLIPFGDTAATSLLTTRVGYWSVPSGTNNQTVWAPTTTTATPGTILAGLGWQVIGEAFSPNHRMYAVGNGLANQVSSRRARGTFAAQTIVGTGDAGFSFLSGVFDGAANLNSLQFGTFIPSDARVGAGQIDQVFAVTQNNGANANINLANMCLGSDTVGNVYLGKSALTNVDVNGFAYLPALSLSQPNNPPAQTFGGVRSGNRVAVLMSQPATSMRMYAFNTTTGGFFFSQFYSYDPTTPGRIPFAGATSTLTDSANLSFAGSTLTVPIVAALGAGSLTLQTGATTMTLANGPAQATIAGDFVPDADRTRSLGANADAWNNLFVGNIGGGGAATNTISFAAAAGAGALTAQTTATSSMRIAHAGGAFPVLWESSTIGLAFFGNAPAAQQVGPASVAGGAYTATEQLMLQRAYNCLRTFGLLN